MSAQSCSECGDAVPQAELDSHDGLCSYCHAELMAQAKAVIERVPGAQEYDPAIIARVFRLHRENRNA